MERAALINELLSGVTRHHCMSDEVVLMCTDRTTTAAELEEMCRLIRTLDDNVEMVHHEHAKKVQKETLRILRKHIEE